MPRAERLHGNRTTAVGGGWQVTKGSRMGAVRPKGSCTNAPRGPPEGKKRSDLLDFGHLEHA